MVRRLFPLALLALVLAACDPPPQTSSSASDGSTTGGTVGPTAEPSPPDPLVPYSPSPSELVPRTTGYVPETLTLPTTEGGTLLVSIDTTALTREFVEDYRPLSVWVTVENPDDEPWTGAPGEFATISDEAGAVFEPIADPSAADLHPKPQRYEASNRNLVEPQTIGAGESLKGVIVFHPTGGNRLITIAISVNAGGVWGEWVTPMGPF